jgi:hypothetical protein
MNKRAAQIPFLLIEKEAKRGLQNAPLLKSWRSSLFSRIGII